MRNVLGLKWQLYLFSYSRHALDDLGKHCRHLRLDAPFNPDMFKCMESMQYIPHHEYLFFTNLRFIVSIKVKPVVNIGDIGCEYLASSRVALLSKICCAATGA